MTAERVPAQPGVMAVWNDLAPGHEAEFEAWYRSQHVPERLRVPGFREARRYEALAGAPRYCAFYWLDSAAVLDSPAYLERLAQPSAWTRRMMPHFRNMGRTPGSVTLDRGAGVGGTMTWLAALRPAGIATGGVVPRAAIAAAFEAGLCDPAWVRMQLWECDPGLAGRDNPEARLRAGRDVLADWIVLVETATPAAAASRVDALAERLRAEPLQANLLRAPVYRLLWRMEAAEAPPPCADPPGLRP